MTLSLSSSVSITKISGWFTFSSGGWLPTTKHLLQKKRRQSKGGSIWTFDTSSYSLQFLTTILNTNCCYVVELEENRGMKIIINCTDYFISLTGGGVDGKDIGHPSPPLVVLWEKPASICTVLVSFIGNLTPPLHLWPPDLSTNCCQGRGGQGQCHYGLTFSKC